MGWWSMTIMGGDEPLDARDTLLFDILGIDSDDYFEDKYTPENIRDLIVSNMEAVHTRCMEWDDIYAQALGVTLMEYGVPNEDPRVKQLLGNARIYAEHDDWAHGNEERLTYINAFIKQLDAYDGTPTEIASEGLFEKIAEKLQSGESGLVNVIPSN